MGETPARDEQQDAHLTVLLVDELGPSASCEKKSTRAFQSSGTSWKGGGIPPP
jgi:hypothetical protein